MRFFEGFSCHGKARKNNGPPNFGLAATWSANLTAAGVFRLTALVFSDCGYRAVYMLQISRAKSAR